MNKRNLMRRLFVLVLAVAMMLSNVTSAFAYDPQETLAASEENDALLESLPEKDATVITLDPEGNVIDETTLEESSEALEESSEALETEEVTEAGDEDESESESESESEKEPEEPEPVEDAHVEYMTRVQTYGELPWVKDGAESGTSGEAKRMEGLAVKVTGSLLSGNIQYRTHVQSYGWMDWKANGALSGTVGEGKRMEAVQITLTGELANAYDIYYRVHVQTLGWLDWAKNGQEAGTSGLAKRVESIQIKLVKKDEAAPGSTTRPYAKLPVIGYQAYMEKYGWGTTARNGETAGVMGEAKRMEGLVVNTAKGSSLTGNVLYRTYCQTYGWKAWSMNWGINGAPGENKRMEAVQICFDGELAKCCNIYYRVHVQSFGWLGWAMNGQTAGTTGLGLRVEAIQIIIAAKDGKQPVTPGNSLKAYTGPGEYVIGKRRYFYTGDGQYIQGTGWFRFNGNRYYAIDGQPAKGWQYIGGLKYFFYDNGVLCQNVDSLIGVQSSYQIRLNKQMNCVTIFAQDGGNGYIIPVKAMLCSTGDDTPLGTFYTPQKYRWKAMYNGTYAQYATRLTAGEGFLFHSITYETTNNHTLIAYGYNGLGIVKSAGCIRLLCSEAYWIYSRCPLHTQVIVYNSDVAGPFDRPARPDPIPADQNYDPTDPFL